MKNIMDNFNNIVIGNGAVATESADNGSIAIGNFAYAVGKNSIAIGSVNGTAPSNTQANGDHSIAIGTSVISNNINGLGEIKIGNGYFNAYYYDGGTGWKVGSDERDKIGITPIQKSLSLITNIDPIRFRYNYRRSYSKNQSLLDYDVESYLNKSKAEKEFNYGVSAQQVASTLKNIYGSEYYGNIITKTVEANVNKIEDCYSINLVNFIPFLIGAIKEQQQQIDELKSKLGDK